MTNHKNCTNIIKKIILAAGSSRRYGKTNKLVQIFQDKPIIRHVIDVLLEENEPKDLLVVVGHEKSKIIDLINNPKIKIVNNIDYKRGIGTSISCAMRHIEDYIQGVMIIPADMPFISKVDLQNLENKFIELNSTKVVFPKYENSLGNPVILPKSYFDILKNLKADEGARSHIKNKEYVTVNAGIGTTLDIDTKEEFNKQNLSL
jgi:CTP:molybdopterin cytidylyltransferase MocA